MSPSLGITCQPWLPFQCCVRKSRKPFIHQVPPTLPPGMPMKIILRSVMGLSLPDIADSLYVFGPSQVDFDGCLRR
jgi:hypothetical protein